MNDTPRTDAQTQTVFTDAGTINAVPQDFARTLERENAQLVEQNERMRQALGELLSYSSKWLPVTFQPWGVNDTDNPLSRARAALNPPPTK